MNTKVHQNSIGLVIMLVSNDPISQLLARNQGWFKVLADILRDKTVFPVYMHEKQLIFNISIPNGKTYKAAQSGTNDILCFAWGRV